MTDRDMERALDGMVVPDHSAPPPFDAQALRDAAASRLMNWRIEYDNDCYPFRDWWVVKNDIREFYCHTESDAEFLQTLLQSHA